jgi:hypothetical protein
VVAVALAGCSNGIPSNQAIQNRVALQAFQGCSELEQYIEDTAILDMRSQLEQQKQGYWYWGLRGEVDFDAAGGPPASPAGPSAYTTTNTQVGGVDEADFVKNDGTRIFVLSGDTLYLSQSWPADQLHNTARLQIEGWPREMYLDGPNVVVFSTVWEPYPFANTGFAADLACSPMWCGYYYGNTTKVTVVDVSNMASPHVSGELFQPGNYSNSRRIGSSVRMVLNDSFRYPPGVRWYPDYDPAFSQDHDLWVRAIDALEAQNERIIRDSHIEQWLPHSSYRDANGQVHDLGYDCSEFHRTNAPTKLGITTVGTLDLSAAAIASNGGAPRLRRTSVIAEPGQIYASQRSLYVASGHWWWWPEPGQGDYTYLHKFDITDPSNARYVASGGVEGHIVDQYAMDEDANGFFRVATTIATREEDPTGQNRWGVMKTTNRVAVLGEQSGALQVVGRSEEVGAGESIRSARFIGDKGFVVTARQVDPFFTFDLSDPANPRRVGELHVPGFSSYLHPIDANTILALGMYTDPTGQNWQERSIRLSLYDISDFAHPREAFTQLVGTAYGWSQALWDPHAFNYFGARKLLAIPFWDYTGNGSGNYWDWYTSDLRVFGVDPATGFTSKGSLNMADVYMSSTYNDWTWYWRPSVSRSVMADDYVYAISDAAIRVANVNSLSTPIATALFDRAVVGTPAPGPR